MSVDQLTDAAGEDENTIAQAVTTTPLPPAPTRWRPVTG